MKVILFPVTKLRHIEGFSQKRVEWLRQKVLKEAIWSKPVALDDRHGLVLDGQHRMEVARSLGLLHIPAVQFRYENVPLRSLRNNHNFTWEDVEARALSGDIFPYKTVKHDFVEPLPDVFFSLKELQQ